MGASLRDRVLMLRTEPLYGVSALRVSPDLRGALDARFRLCYAPLA
jgi:hypothetical protein